MNQLRLTKQTIRVLTEALINQHELQFSSRHVTGYNRMLKRQKQIKFLLKKVRGY